LHDGGPGGVILVAKKYQRWVHLSVQVHLYPWNFCTEKDQQQQLAASSPTGAIKASWEIDFIWSHSFDLFSCRHPLLHRFALSSNRNFPPRFYK